MKFRHFLALLVLTGCSGGAQSTPTPTPAQFILHSSRNDVEQRFDVVVRSLDKRKLCLQPEQWPGLGGMIERNVGVSVTVDGSKHDADEYQSGFCYGRSCGKPIVIKPGQEVRTFVSYKQFHSVAISKAVRDVTLEYPLHPYACADGPAMSPGPGP